MVLQRRRWQPVAPAKIYDVLQLINIRAEQIRFWSQTRSDRKLLHFNDAQKFTTYQGCHETEKELFAKSAVL